MHQDLRFDKFTAYVKMIFMDIESFHDYCLAKKEVNAGFPFANLPKVLVFKVAGKMFAATDVNLFASISIRCNPETIDELRARYPALQEPSYFSKRHWSRIVMDNSLQDQLIFKWIDESYEMAVSKLTRKMKTELGL